MEVTLNYMHILYLITIIAVIFLMIKRRDVVMPCILGMFIIGVCYFKFSFIGGARSEERRVGKEC